MDTEKIKQNLLEEFDLGKISEDKKDSLIQTMTLSLLKRITLRILETLSEEEREEFDRISDLKDAQKMEDFLKGKIENYEAMVEEVIKEFKEEVKSDIEELKTELEKEQ